MSENGSSHVKDLLGEFSKTFKNLLKEFPKTAVDDFIYDDSTMKKIAKASASMLELYFLFGKKTTAFVDIERIKESHAILSQLMDEVPKDPADDFAYDRAIHQMVEDARHTLAELDNMAS